MTAQLAPLGIQRFADNNGNPLAFGLVYSYAAGTTTPQATYTDSTQSTPNPNPIPLNFRGEASIWLDPTLGYKLNVTDQSGNQIPGWPVDNIPGGFGALPISVSLIPTPTNTFTLGNSTHSWANIYLGANAAPAYDPVSGNIGYYARTAAEIAAGVTPTNYAYPPLDSRRYGFTLGNSPSNGATNATLMTAVLSAAGLAAASTGQAQEVVLYPGTYTVTRVYINYSNVSLRILPGATILCTTVGALTQNSTGQMPAYAIVHINPLNYTVNPGSAITPISNVIIYGGGTIQGPNATNPGSYQPFQLGVVANDCNSFWIEGIHILGCGGETLLGDPSSWNTCSDLRAIGCEFQQGGEVGFNNCRASVMLYNYMHDNWFQNGIGADGDNIVIGWNRVRNMQNSGINFGGSGARDLVPNGVARDILCIGNVVTATGLANTGAYQLFMTDDGATTVPKYNIKVIGNIFDNHIGPDQIAADYNSGNVEFIDNTVTNLQGTSANAFNVIAGSASYILRGNVFSAGTLGNPIIGLTVSSGGSPTVTVEESNTFSGFSTANINWSTPIILNQEFDFSFTLTLTGFAAGQNVPCVGVKKGNLVRMFMTGTVAASNSTTMTLGTLPVYLRPVRNQNGDIVLMSSGNNVQGIYQVATTGVITFFSSISGGAFVNDGLNKGLAGPYSADWILN